LGGIAINGIFLLMNGISIPKRSARCKPSEQSQPAPKKEPLCLVAESLTFPPQGIFRKLISSCFSDRVRTHKKEKKEFNDTGIDQTACPEFSH